MKTISLPDSLNLDKGSSIEIFDYKSSKEISKQQIILNKHTFSFLVEGNKEVFFDNSSFSIENDRFLLMKSGHCLMTEKLSSENNNYASVLFFFPNDLLLKFIRKYDIKRIAAQAFPSVYAFPYDPFIKRFVSSLLDITKLPLITQRKLLEVKFEEIILYLLEAGQSDFVHALIAHSNDQTQQFIKTIESNQLNKLTVKELAFLCNMSVSTFKREFEKQFKESPIKWFQHKRLEYAHHLIKDEQKRASDIYFEVGYENLSSFVQAYKDRFGVTPTQHYAI